MTRRRIVRHIASGGGSRMAVVLITGTNSGIGPAAALHFAR
jgi:hypothetical protein